MFTSKLNFNGSQFYREIPIFSYFKKLEQSFLIISLNICDPKLIKNEAIVKIAYSNKTSLGRWVLVVKAVLCIVYSNQLQYF